MELWKFFICVTGSHLVFSGSLWAGRVSCGPVPELVPPVVGPGGAAAELRGTRASGRGGGGGNRLPESPGAAALPLI